MERAGSRRDRTPGDRARGQDTGQVLRRSREAASSGGGSQAGPKAPGSARTPCGSRGRPQGGLGCG